VALDLSACTGVTEFDPGADRIVSLVLPDTATGIKTGTYDNPTFEHFTALTSVSGKNIETIGGNAFRNCDTLTTVSLPNATTIDYQAFLGCTALTTLSLPNATTIKAQTFDSCTALTTLSLPAVTSIGNGAFLVCTALSTVSLPAVTSIDMNVFVGCTALSTVSLPRVTSIGNDVFVTNSDTALTIILPQAAPTLASSSPASSGTTTYTKNVTVKTPAGRTGYDSTWEAAFKKVCGERSGVTINLSITDL
jgi:hypothetical protein